ncbi:hypothetical protein [Streptomyces sp. V17-9]|uniref:hypothetical protein n=1 Tax=Streptomyces sp. V17-9 TaxID=2831149 RepID=UPI001BAE9C5E|nr:hypothetical protein [Streptomyces sp. V17-9]QUW95697.1 hypothetical protein KE639_06967 [Streptomyces sp. V17-9]
MTTGSSSARSPEYAISALDLPTGETTTTTGTARPPGADPGARTSAERPSPERDSDMWDVDFDDDDLPELEPDPDLPASGSDGPGPRQPGPGPREADADADPHAAPHADPHAHADVHDEAARTHGDPVGDLVRTAVADRPLEEVVDLITTLEKSPRYAQATIDALRAVGVNRSVEDVTRLVGLLTRPPRHSDSADEAIRAAAECRSVEDVTRLMALLHRTPLEPHCGQEAVRAAATGRPVEELVELIGRLAEDGHLSPERPDARHLRAARDAADEDDGREPAARPAGRGGAFGGTDRRGRERRVRPRPFRRGRDARDASAAAREGDETRSAHDRDRPRTPRDRDDARASRDRDKARSARDRDEARAARRAARGPVWPAWLTAAVLAGCGVVYFPLHRGDASAQAYGVALGLSALCLVLALLLTVRSAVPLLAAAVVGPAALAAAKLYGSATPSARVSPVTDLTLAPTWIAVAVAVAASLVALTALCVRVAAPASARRRPARRVAVASRTAAD